MNVYLLFVFVAYPNRKNLRSVEKQLNDSIVVALGDQVHIGLHPILWTVNLVVLSTIRLTMSPIQYDESFKQNAVSLVEAGTPASQVARDLGISAHLVYAWRRQ